MSRPRVRHNSAHLLEGGHVVEAGGGHRVRLSVCGTSQREALLGHLERFRILDSVRGQRWSRLLTHELSAAERRTCPEPKSSLTLAPILATSAPCLSRCLGNDMSNRSAASGTDARAPNPNHPPEDGRGMPAWSCAQPL
eukprot:scaffold113535_cov24-Tisochrysis_lutea.AAC.2